MDPAGGTEKPQRPTSERTELLNYFLACSLPEFRRGLQVEEGIDLLMARPWPEISGRHLFRRFFVLVPDDRA
jgi:hypothetical protein